MSDEHYFSADPSVAFQRAPVEAEVWGHELRLVSGSGVFAQGRLDIGTSVLFRETEPPRGQGTYLDLGCGYGVIGLALAQAVPGATVWGVDVNERALDLPPRGHIDQHCEHGAGTLAVSEPGQHRIRPKNTAIGPDITLVERDRTPGFQKLLRGGNAALAVVGMRHIKSVERKQFLA